ncbi:hypothetical protein RDV89_18715 [Nocardioides zeae]|uniref:Uncharacterized protein n=1 Tax=Nocardioides imazamoxiresistens TaxID=3231893 RepID=A0ABU3Q0T5_9ACTN|nr:hypothetical protein [Nocardioides zeae]MDT9595127.1 hypothetical protein [Nocardioides zeae]
MVATAGRVQARRFDRARRGAAAAALLAMGGAALAACSGGDDEAAPTPTVTVTETVTPDASPTSTGTGGSDEGGAGGGATSTPTTAPTDGGGGAGGALPTDAQAYAQAFVDAWQAGDRPAAEQLVRDLDDADELFDEDDLRGTPALQGCEGAAGSSYCTFVGDNYQVVVQVGNEAASAGQPGAISDVEVDD